MKFENYRRAAIGDLAYVENLLLTNPNLIDVSYDGFDDNNDSLLMQALTTYSSFKLGHYYRLIGARISDFGHNLIGNSFDLYAFYIRALAWSIRPGIIIGELIFVSTELTATIAVHNQKRYLKEHKGWSLLDFAVENGQISVVEYLIRRVSNIDTKRLFDIVKTNRLGKNFLISFIDAIKERAEKEKLKNDNVILQKNLQEALGYAEKLLEAYESSHIGLVDNDFWYDDEHINNLLKLYFPITQNDIRALPALEWNENNSDIHMLIKTRFTNAIGYHPDCFVYFLPLEVNKNHWIGLYVDRTPEKECVLWIDPMGGITEKWKDSILNILNDKEKIGLFANDINEEHIHVLPYRLQNDGFNCGPWVVELLRFFAANQRFPVAGEIDIGAKRQEHLAILNPKKSLTALELQGASERLDDFGVFGGLNPAVAARQSSQINMSL